MVLSLTRTRLRFARFSSLHCSTNCKSEGKLYGSKSRLSLLLRVSCKRGTGEAALLAAIIVGNRRPPTMGDYLEHQVCFHKAISFAQHFRQAKHVSKSNMVSIKHWVVARNNEPCDLIFLHYEQQNSATRLATTWIAQGPRSLGGPRCFQRFQRAFAANTMGFVKLRFNSLINQVLPVFLYHRLRTHAESERGCSKHTKPRVL